MFDHLKPVGLEENDYAYDGLRPHKEPVEDVIHLPSVISKGDWSGVYYEQLGKGPKGNWHGTYGGHARATAVESV